MYVAMLRFIRNLLLLLRICIVTQYLFSVYGDDSSKKLKFRIFYDHGGKTTQFGLPRPEHCSHRADFKPINALQRRKAGE